MHLHMQVISTYLYNRIRISYLTKDGMCDGMNINRRLLLIGVMLIVLSMTMATQYTQTKISYRYNVVHPSETDLRFIGSDDSSDNIKVLRMTDDNATTGHIELRLGGNISANQNKTYTAAFGIVNEEQFSINITHINVTTSGTGSDYMQIWLHGDRDKLSNLDDSAVLAWDKGNPGYDNDTSIWVLAAGNQDAANMCADGTTQLSTGWDSNAHVRYSTNDANNSVTSQSDFVWVQISLDLPADADTDDTYTGTVWIFTRAGT